MRDGWVGPLALGFDAEVAAYLGEGNLDRPWADEPAYPPDHPGRIAVASRSSNRLAAAWVIYLYSNLI